MEKYYWLGEKNLILSISLDNCSGCTACVNICSQNAISMVPNDKGFLYPRIDPQLCIDCGLCKRICPLQNIKESSLGFLEPDVYAVKHRSDEVRITSSSGGMFTAISDYVLENGGIIYGAAFNDNFSVCHKRAYNLEQRDQFKGSKYVQSDLNQTFTHVKSDLLAGLLVLFSGTPCQVAGLKGFLGSSKIVDNLITVDLICHGVPSPRIFQDYLQKRESVQRAKIKNINFRSKLFGWKKMSLEMDFSNGEKTNRLVSEDPYYRLFLQNTILRDSCYQCKFASINRHSDFTIGDFWGIERSMPDFEDQKGVSIVLLNSGKGKEIFDRIKDDLIYKETNIVDCIQPNLQHPSIPSPEYKEFWLDYEKHGYEFVARKYGGMNFKEKLKRIIKKTVSVLGIFDLVKKLINNL